MVEQIGERVRRGGDGRDRRRAPLRRIGPIECRQELEKRIFLIVWDRFDPGLRMADRSLCVCPYACPYACPHACPRACPHARSIDMSARVSIRMCVRMPVRMSAHIGLIVERHAGEMWPVDLQSFWDRLDDSFPDCRMADGSATCLHGTRKAISI